MQDEIQSIKESMQDEPVRQKSRESGEGSTPGTIVMQGDVRIIDLWLIQGASHLVSAAVMHTIFCGA